MFQHKNILTLLLCCISYAINGNTQEILYAQKISFIEAFMHATFIINKQGAISYKHYEQNNKLFTLSIDQFKDLLKEIENHANFIEDGWIPTELNEKIRAHKINSPHDMSEFNKLEWQLERLCDFLYGQDLQHLSTNEQKQIKEHRQQFMHACRQGNITNIQDICLHNIDLQQPIDFKKQLQAFVQKNTCSK